MFHIESRKVSLLKGVTWRVIGTLDTIFLSWLFTGDISKALSIGGIELFTKIILFYLHERAWIFFHIGKKQVISGSGKITYEDLHWRSVVKGISWRLLGSIDTIIIAFIITGDSTKAFEIGFTEVFTKMILFYLHERIWLKLLRIKA
ncbi:MAG TPA: DUF2061 domain-containing protein [Ignavibacteria bacterium]|nr:DUF2061 domain-containing protein [Ignavibacteria bacterium]